MRPYRSTARSTWTCLLLVVHASCTHQGVYKHAEGGDATATEASEGLPPDTESSSESTTEESSTETGPSTVEESSSDTQLPELPKLPELPELAKLRVGFGGSCDRYLAIPRAEDASGLSRQLAGSVWDFDNGRRLAFHENGAFEDDEELGLWLAESGYLATAHWSREADLGYEGGRQFAFAAVHENQLLTNKCGDIVFRRLSGTSGAKGLEGLQGQWANVFGDGGIFAADDGQISMFSLILLEELTIRGDQAQLNIFECYNEYIDDWYEGLYLRSIEGHIELEGATVRFHREDGGTPITMLKINDEVLRIPNDKQAPLGRSADCAWQ